MRAGELRERVKLQEKAVTRDAVGGEAVTWKDRATVWAAVEPLSGRELFAAQQVQAETSVRIRMRYWSEVAPEWRVVWQDRVYEVQSVIDTDAAGRELQLMCRTGVKSG
jgi:SPP1 family predicted phage head-tail adaptor